VCSKAKSNIPPFKNIPQKLKPVLFYQFTTIPFLVKSLCTRKFSPAVNYDISNIVNNFAETRSLWQIFSAFKAKAICYGATRNLVVQKQSGMELKVDRSTR